MTGIKPIKTEADYERALKRIEELWECDPRSPGADELEILSIIVESYEREHYPVPAPDLTEAIKFRIEQLGLTQEDFAPLIGTPCDLAEVAHEPASVNRR